MRLTRGLRTLVTDTRYNFSFLLSLVAAAIITMWVVIIGVVDPPNITDPVQGIGISVVVSFQYFMIALVILSVLKNTRFFEGKRAMLNQFLLCIAFILVFVVLGPVSAAIGPIVGAALTFCDAVITSFFAVLLGWDIGKTVYTKIGERSRLNWILFLVFLLLDFAVFGGAYFYLGLNLLPFESQIVLLMFPLGIVVLPILTILFRSRSRGPDQTSLMMLVLFVLGIYYTFRLISISDPQLALTDVVVQLLLMVYGLATTVSKIEDKVTVSRSFGLTLVLFAILSRVGSYVNRLLAAATAWGNIVQVGITSFTILNLAVLGLIVPAVWMWRRKKTAAASSE